MVPYTATALVSRPALTSRLRLCVVVPTTHRVTAVSALVNQVRATCPCPHSIVVVDNAPNSSQASWEGVDCDEVIARPEYLGSGESFRVGLQRAREICSPWTLLLDHDAVLLGDTLRVLMAFAEQHGSDAYSCNQNGSMGGWAYVAHGEVVRVGPQLTDTLPRPRLAQWSGMLLSSRAADAVAAYPTDYFFSWDDYLVSDMLWNQGMQIIGVKDAVVGNSRDPRLLPWRHYYSTRNHVLFLQDIGALTWRVRLTVARRHLRLALGQARRGKRGDALAVATGLFHGMRNVRGFSRDYSP